MRSSILLLGASLLLWTGCTTDIGETAKSKKLNSISVDRRVDLQSPLRGVFDSNSGSLSVALAEFISNEMDKKKIEKLSRTMQDNDIHIPEMVRTQVIELLQKGKGIQVVTNTGDAVLVVSIRQYGIDGGNSEDSKQRPFIELSAELVRNGQRLWRAKEAIPPTPFAGPKAELQEYQANPALLREHWRIQIDHAARRLLTVKKPSQ
jgi:hypothetical protein